MAKKETIVMFHKGYAHMRLFLTTVHYFEIGDFQERLKSFYHREYFIFIRLFWSYL